MSPVNLTKLQLTFLLTTRRHETLTYAEIILLPIMDTLKYLNLCQRKFKCLSILLAVSTHLIHSM